MEIIEGRNEKRKKEEYSRYLSKMDPLVLFSVETAANAAADSDRSALEASGCARRPSRRQREASQSWTSNTSA